jgi:DNA-binding response OmpR family regulator
VKRVLLIEDNALKEVRMKEALAAIPEIEFTVCKSIKAAYPSLDLQEWDLILLDMSFQVNPGAGTEVRKKPLAGRQILQFMRARQMCQPVIVVTQHASFSEGHTVIASIDDLDVKLKKYFPAIYRKTIYVDLATDAWREPLIREARRAFKIT